MGAHRASGFTVWMTGLSGAGKSTLAASVAAEVRRIGMPVEILDGDEVREQLSPELGFARADREIHVRRLGYLSALLSRNGTVVIVAAISPYAGARFIARQMHTAPFVEVFVDCDMDVLIARDTKGLYRRALCGELPLFTGISDPYEAPIASDSHIRTHEVTVVEATQQILEMLSSKHLLPRPQSVVGIRSAHIALRHNVAPFACPICGHKHC